MEAVDAARESPAPVALRGAHAQRLKALFEPCVRHAEAKHEKTRVLALELLNDRDGFRVVVDHPELPVSNNTVEGTLQRRLGCVVGAERNRAPLRVHFDTVLAKHLDHSRDVRRTRRNLAVQCGKHSDCFAPPSRDFQHFTAA